MAVSGDETCEVSPAASARPASHNRPFQSKDGGRIGLLCYCGVPICFLGIPMLVSGMITSADEHYFSCQANDWRFTRVA